MLAWLKQYWTVLRINIDERLVYRGDFMLGTLMRFLPVITQVFLWSAVFAAAPPSGAATGAPGSSPTSIAGYRFPDMIAYYLLAMIGRAFSSMPGLASGIG